MSKSQNDKNFQQSGSEPTEIPGKAQGLLGLAPYFTACIDLTVFNGSVLAQSPVKMAGSHEPPERSSDDITGLSKNSRLRLIKLMSSLHWQTYQTAIFSTLTYHNEYPQTGKEVKIELDKFIKRMERSFPSLHFVWRMELQKRGAPHFHFIYFIPKSKTEVDERLVKDTIRRHWSDINPCGCDDCVNYGTKSEYIENFSKCLAYISKYVAKETKGTEASYSGRRWGYSRKLHFAPLESFKLTGLQFIYFKLLLLSAYAQNEKRRAYISEHLKNIYSTFLLTEPDVVRPVLVTVLRTEPKEIYKVLTKASCLPYGFEFPSGDIRISKQLPFRSQR